MELLHVGFLSTLLLGTLGICFVEPKERGEWAMVGSLGLLLGSVALAYIGLLLRGPEGWPWDKSALPDSPSLWGSVWPQEHWMGVVLLALSLALTSAGLVLLGLRWSALQAERNRMEALGGIPRRVPDPGLSLSLLSGGLLLAWPTWSTIAVWFVLILLLAATRWQIPRPPEGASARGPSRKGERAVEH